MNDNAALNLIRSTFENSFDRERFLIFAKNLFHFLDTETFIYRGNLIPGAYDAHIKTLERLGKYEDVDGHKIEVLAVCLNKQSSLERARTLQRNFIAWYLNGSRGGITKDAALVAFYTKDSDDWRLSLVKMDYHLGESKAGKIKAITELTPARRFSFLVGANENTHTAQKQFLPILKDTDFKPDLSDLESAFSVEVVTKDFFEKYKKLFLDTKEALDAMVVKDAKIKADFQEKNIDTADFAKKLLGQIVFLYFLQKKGWFGVERGYDWGTGSKTFLRDLFNGKVVPYKNFFNDVLEPLFYDALARDRSDVDYFNPQFNGKIPFLNGGLFDPIGGYDWVGTDIDLPNDLFSNKKSGYDEGTGILDIFDLYNFTVKEDEPLEREVAVDPEMLGKVFENLLEVKDRKSKGTYYTPREIVHYMCQESLINYLLTELDNKVKRDDIETLIRLGETAIENEALVMDKGFETKDHHFKLPQSIRQNASLIDEKLEKIRVCDPAVGSGAFLVGMMTEIIRVRNVLTNYLSDNGRSIYDFKRHAIQNCLYGVDIDPGAVEIAKLRLWLSLIVDEQDIKQIKPLPNLDYKIMQGNSLLEEYEGIKLFDEGIVSASPLDNTKQIEELKQKQSELQREYFRLLSVGELKGSKKQQIDIELKSCNDRLYKLTKAPKVKADNSSLFDQDSAAKQKSDELKKLHQEFFEMANKREKDEIKKKIEVLEWELIEATLREQNKLSLLPEIEHFKKANIKPFFLWKLNFSDVFEKNGGFDVVIANSPYISFGLRGTEKLDTGWVNSLRDIYPNSAEYKLSIYAIFMDRGLQLLPKGGILCYVTPDSFLLGRYFSKIRRYILDISKIITILMFEKDFWESGVVGRPVITFLQTEKNSDLKRSNTPVFRLYTSLENFNKNIVQEFSYPQDYFENTSYNRFRLFFESGQKTLADKLQVKSRPLSDYVAFASGLIGKKGKNGIISKIKLGSDWLPGLLSGGEITKYTVNYEGNFILFDQKKLKSGFKDADYFKPKILLRQTGDSLIAAYDDQKLLCLNNLHVGNLRDNQSNLKYILALLNSSLLSYYYRLISLESGRTMAQIDIETLEELPIKGTEGHWIKELSALTDKAISAGKEKNKEKLENLQKKIDQLVYELYGLTSEGISVVEGKNG